MVCTSTPSASAPKVSIPPSSSSAPMSPPAPPAPPVMPTPTLSRGAFTPPSFWAMASVSFEENETDALCEAPPPPPTVCIISPREPSAWVRRTVSSPSRTWRSPAVSAALPPMPPTLIAVLTPDPSPNLLVEAPAAPPLPPPLETLCAMAALEFSPKVSTRVVPSSVRSTSPPAPLLAPWPPTETATETLILIPPASSSPPSPSPGTSSRSLLSSREPTASELLSPPSPPPPPTECARMPWAPSPRVLTLVSVSERPTAPPSPPVPPVPPTLAAPAIAIWTSASGIGRSSA